MDSADHADRALRLADASGDPRLQLRARADSFEILGSSLFGYVPLSEIERRQASLMAFARQHGLQLLQTWISGIEAGLLAYRGQFEDARSALAEQQDQFRDLGLPLWAAVSSQMGGRIEQLADDQVARERVLRQGYEALMAIGERGFLSTVAADLADALAQLGRLDEADAMAQAALEAGAADDVVTQDTVRIARARIALGRGDLAAAERFAREAMALADASEFYDEHTETRFALAEVLVATGRPEAAADLWRDVIERARRKEDLPTAARAEALLAQHTGSPAEA